MKKVSRLLLILMLVMIPAGIGFSQFSSSYSVQQVALTSGGLSSSTSYKAVAAVGQPAVDVVSSSSYQVSAGFLQTQIGETEKEYELWIPIILD